MIHSIFKTDTKNTSYFIIRIVLALVILPHGLQKIFGIFGGYGFEGTMQYFTATAGVPWLAGFLVIIAETLGALSLIAGFLSRFVAASLILVMAGAASMHFANGFFMNWFGNQPGEGIEFFLLAGAMALQVTIEGGGKWSLDGLLAGLMERKNKSTLKRKFETSI